MITNTLAWQGIVIYIRLCFHNHMDCTLPFGCGCERLVVTSSWGQSGWRARGSISLSASIPKSNISFNVSNSANDFSQTPREMKHDSFLFLLFLCGNKLLL